MSRTTRATAWRILLAGPGHPDQFTRTDAARLLGELGDRRAVPALTRMLMRDEHPSKITAIYALGAIADRRAAGILRRMSDDPGVFLFPGKHNHDMLRLAAALELARWNDPSGVQAVTDLLRIPGLEAMFQLAAAIHAAPRNRATKTLRTYVNSDFIRSMHHARLNATQHFFVARGLSVHRDAPAQRQLVEYLTHFSRYVRAEAVSALLTNDAQTFRGAVLRCYRRERSPFARIRMATLLHRHDVTDAAATITTGLRNRDAFVRATALDSAAALRLPIFKTAATKLLADPDFYVRTCASAAIEALDRKRAQPLLAPLLRDPHPRVALQAAKSLIACEQR